MFALRTGRVGEPGLSRGLLGGPETRPLGLSLLPSSNWRSPLRARPRCLARTWNAIRLLLPNTAINPTSSLQRCALLVMPWNGAAGRRPFFC